MAASRGLRVRDSIHGLIEYSERERDLMDSPVLQRLRGIKQLALTCLVYPGATHTRFEHSLGVMYLAGRIADRLNLTERQIRLVRAAALLHDIGHLPFSHAGEAAAAALTPGLRELGEEAHERITWAFIEQDEELRGILGRDCDGVLDILEKGKRRTKGWEPLLSHIVSGPLDADKLDYLLRDSLMAGVKYGVFDVERLVDSFVAYGQSSDRSLLVRREDSYCVEQMLLARYYITEQVYRHRVRRITDAMLRHAVIATRDIDNPAAKEVRNLFRVRPDSPRWRKQFLLSNDCSVLTTLAETPAGTTCHKLADRLLSRRLLKEILAHPIAGIGGTQWTDGLIRDPTNQDKTAKRLARALDMPSDEVILDLRTRDNPLYRDPDLPMEEEIRLVDEKGIVRRLADVEGSLVEAAKPRAERDICLYVPADAVSKRERQQLRQKVLRELTRIAREANP